MIVNSSPSRKMQSVPDEICSSFRNSNVDACGLLFSSRTTWRNASPCFCASKFNALATVAGSAHSRRSSSRPAALRACPQQFEHNFQSFLSYFLKRFEDYLPRGASHLRAVSVGSSVFFTTTFSALISTRWRSALLNS